MQQIHDKVVTFLPPESIEPQALNQIYQIAKLPIIYKPVPVMPDCHLGKGRTLGSVTATQAAIIPAARGVEIACGMLAVRTWSSASALPDNLEAVRTGIERRIPLGTG